MSKMRRVLIGRGIHDGNDKPSQIPAAKGISKRINGYLNQLIISHQKVVQDTINFNTLSHWYTIFYVNYF